MVFALKYILIFAFSVVTTGCGDEAGTPPLTSNSFLACETQDIVKKVKSEPPVLHECSAGSIRSADMLALVSNGVSDEELLSVWSLDGYSGFTPAQLKVAGISISEMQAAGLSLWQIHVGGVSLTELQSSGVSVSELIRLGASVSELQAAGISISDLQTAGVTIYELLIAGVSIADLRTAGTTITDLRSHGLTTYELHTGGFTIAQMQAVGMTISQIHAGGVSIPHLRSANITISQLRTSGISISELNGAGITILDLQAAGISIAELLGAGITISELRTAGISDQVVFNEACNTLQSIGTTPGPRITNVTSTDTQVVLRAETRVTTRWEFSGTTVTFSERDPVNDTETLGNATARLISKENNNYVSTLSIPFADVFSNPGVTVVDSQLRETTLNLCPGN